MSRIAEYAKANEMKEVQLRAVARSLAYTIYDSSAFTSQLRSADQTDIIYILASLHRNLISEFWHCLNRKWYVEGPDVGLRMIGNEDIDKAKADTLAWLKWYRRGGHKQSDETPDEDRIPMPEWGKEYT